MTSTQYATLRVELLNTTQAPLCSGWAMLWSRGAQWGGEVFSVERGSAGVVQPGPALLGAGEPERCEVYEIQVHSIEAQSSGGESTVRVRFRGTGEESPLTDVVDTH